MNELHPSHTINIHGATLSAYVAGAGETLLFLHGNAGRWQHWEPQLLVLARQFLCIAFDFRGYGASSPLNGPNSLSLMAEDAYVLCQALAVTRVFVVGLSMGGAVAQALALRHPDLVAGLVLVSPQAIDVVPAVLPELTSEMLRPLFEASFSPQFRERQPALVARLIAEQLETRLETLRTIAFDDLPMNPTAIRAPTLVLAGGSDALMPVGEAQRLATRIASATFCALPGVGHVLNSEAPEALNSAIERFVAAHREPGVPSQAHRA